MASKALLFYIALLGELVVTSLMHSHCIPSFFLALLASPEEQKQALAYLQKMWKSLVVLESFFLGKQGSTVLSSFMQVAVLALGQDDLDEAR